MPKTASDLTNFDPIFIRYDIKIAPKKRAASDVSTDPALQAIAKGVVDGDEDVVGENAKKAIDMLPRFGVPILGLVENMSYFIAPDTGNRYNIFGEGGGQRLADQYGVPFLGSVPLSIEVREGGDKGVPVVVSQPESPQAQAFKHVAEEVARQVSIEAMKPELVVLGKSQ